MAEGDATVYNNGKEQLMLGTFNLGTGGSTMKVALVTGYTPNIDTHQTFADVVANEASGSGYTARGATLANQAVTQDNTNDRAAFDADDVTYTGLSVGTPSHAIVYKDTGTNSTSHLLMYFELGRASNGGNYTLSFNSIGLLTLA